MNTNLLNDLVELCARKGIENAVICPGSRSAPLTLSFVRNKRITCRTFSDERSAGFIALGIAQSTKRPVVLICTSGSAAFNFAPAVAEAFFQHIPLLVLTADRPAEWIDQLDGQTIRQREIYGAHVKKFFELPLDSSHPDAEWHSNRILNEAINLASTGQQGPVHINAPFREPLYPAFVNASETSIREMRIVSQSPSDQQFPAKELAAIAKHINESKRILVVVGQHDRDDDLKKSLSEFSKTHSWTFAGDILSNFHELEDFCGFTDTFLGQLDDKRKEALRPDLLITFGKSLISKNLKLFLRKYKPFEHWHIQESDYVADTFQSLTKIINTSPAAFFQSLNREKLNNSFWNEYKKQWTAVNRTTRDVVSGFLQKNKGEFSFIKDVLHAIPANANLHLANSMTVRYANHIGLTSANKGISVFSNRGTSGIDGCTSTAVGHSLADGKINILITGDLAFFYDRNAFWHNYKLPNLFVVVINNHGGVIFNLIDGPKGLPESQEYFVTQQKLNARALANEFGLTYLTNSDALDVFFQPTDNAAVYEYESSQEFGKNIFEDFKKHINQNL